jgi:choline kinase
MSSRKKLRRTSTAVSSDTEYTDVDLIVPTCDVILDNSKTLAYSGGFTESEKEDGQRPPLVRVSTSVQKDAWKSFKYEIVRLAHTLRLRAWRRVPMDMSDQIEVERLSGALTNAVYVVSPPKTLPAKTSNTIDGTTSAHPKEPPP